MILTGMDADAGGSDDISATVAGSVADAMARRAELESDTHGQGSALGDLVALPDPPDIDTTVLLGPSA
jgi:hypothetical protein